MQTSREPYTELDLAGDLARRQLYLFISRATTRPDEAVVRNLADPGFQTVVRSALDLIAEDPTFHPATLGPGELDPSCISSDFVTGCADAARDGHLGMFGHGLSKECPPYEIEYIRNREINHRGHQLADIAGFYKAFGLGRASDTHERIDHVSMETEFMAVLLEREVYARRGGLGAERVEVSREAQRKFFGDHLGWWLPAFGAVVTRKAKTGFYADFGNFLRVFAGSERAVLDLPPFQTLASTDPIPINDDPMGLDSESCQACMEHDEVDRPAEG